MNMKKRINKVNGLQQSWVNIQKEGSPPSKSKVKKTKKAKPPKQQPSISTKQEEKVIVQEEKHTFDGKEIYSHHPTVYEVFKMADETDSKTNVRAVGVDIGTGFISCAEKEGKSVRYRKIRDAFFKLNPSKFLEGSANQFGESMLKNAGAHYVKVDDTLFVLGDDAFKFASLFHQECLRPMSKGVLNPKEPVSSLMVSELVKAVAGRPTNSKDVLYYCVPAEPVDADFDVEYHKQILSGTFEQLGYENINVMTEGLAVVYSELADTQYTGIGISFGAGMCNVVYSFMGIPVFAFSLSRGGDWIDSHAAKHTDETHNVVTSIKEKGGFSLYDNTTGIQKAICIYYESLLNYLVEQFKEIYEKTPKKKLPNVTMELPVVIAGGTSLMVGFVEKLRELMQNDFPVPISEVRHAEEPLFAVSNGLYEAAKLSAKET
jgi:actin-like ATPase involved in cell morphogenesis